MRKTVVVGLLLAAAASAQMMSPWWEGPLVRDLNLSEDQQKKIHTTVAGSRSKIILLRATLEAAEADLGEMMAEDPVDPKKGAAAIEKVLAARTDLGRQVAQMSLALRQVLTARQWHELERRQRERMPGPNGPNGPNRMMQPNGPNGPNRMMQPNGPNGPNGPNRMMQPGPNGQPMMQPGPGPNGPPQNPPPPKKDD